MNLEEAKKLLVDWEQEIERTSLVASYFNENSKLKNPVRLTDLLQAQSIVEKARAVEIMKKTPYTPSISAFIEDMEKEILSDNQIQQ